MNMRPQSGLDGSTAFLKRFVKRRQAEERCELCGQDVGPVHEHLLELAARRLVCSCGACALLFSGQAVTKFRRVPRRRLALPDFVMSDAQWGALNIPINMAFFYVSSLSRRPEVMYPSPAGPTEALLAQEAWTEAVTANPVLVALEPDVEALLVNRITYARGAGNAEYFVVPIDECFRLVGLIRLHWKGFSGGSEVWLQIGKFFAELKTQARTVRESAHA